MQMHILPVTPLAQQAPAVAPASSENPGTVPPWLTTVRRAHNGNPGIVPPWFTGTSFGDIIRYNLTVSPAAGSPTPWNQQFGPDKGSQLCLPLPQVEILNNPLLH